MNRFLTLYAHAVLNVLVALTLTASNGSTLCPNACVCDYQATPKRATCYRGGMNAIPTAEIDKDVELIVITAPKNNLNFLTLDGVFVKYHKLVEVRITLSNIPAIGNSPFSQFNDLEVLNLSHNNITLLISRDFHVMGKLRVLNLGYNNIEATSTAPFRYLSNLKKLSLNYNKLKTLKSSFSVQLDNLEFLDLSGNPLGAIDSDDFKNLKSLKRLDLSNCRLNRLQFLISQQLSNLEELNLDYNFVEQLSPIEFRHLTKLRILNLNRNQLKAIADRTFEGCSFKRLTMSRNKLAALPSCTFCNATVHDLDLSNNVFNYLGTESLAPIANALWYLNLGHNYMETEKLRALIRSLTSLKGLSLAGMGLDALAPDTFENNGGIVNLNLRRNRIANVSIDMIRPLKELKELDLSYNQLREIYPTLLAQTSNTTKLSVLYLHGNPWACESCQIRHFLIWLSKKPLYRDACAEPDIDDECIRCATPASLARRDLFNLTAVDIPHCELPVSKLQVVGETSQLGLMVVVILILSVVPLVVVFIVIIYNRRGGVYYTGEDARSNSNDVGEIYTWSFDRINEIVKDESPPPTPKLFFC